MASTFDGASFEERGSGNGTFFPAHGGKCNYTILKIPGGSKTVIQVGTYAPVEVTIPIQMTAAQLATMRGKANVRGSLVYNFGTYTATLIELGGVNEVKPDKDYYQADARFLVEWWL